MDIGTLTGQIAIEDNATSVLSRVSNEVKSFANSIRTLDGIVVAAGAAIVGSITAISTSIVMLGNRGSDVNDVANTFENFSGSVDVANQSLEEMRQGTLGTVTDFDLMKSASKLLAGDVKLTSEQFGLMSKAAFVLQNQGLGPTKEMLDLVSQAMLTGQTRTLQMKLGKIDLKRAEEDYARKLGVQREQLTQLGKTEAARTAILELLNRKVREAGQQQRDFGEIMEAVVVSVKNWGDQLASAVARSPNVLNAVKAIGDALSNAFGGSAQSALQTILGWINKFADAVAHYGPIVINWVANIIEKVRAFYNRVLEYWDTVPDWFKRIAKEAVVTAGVLYASKEAIQAVTGAQKDQLDILSQIGGAFSGFRDLMLSLIGLQAVWATNIWASVRAVKALALTVKEFGLVQSASLAGLYLWEAGLGALVASITSVGTAIGVFLISPLGLVTLAIPALILAIRGLTGSWEFLLTPMRGAWQVLKDVWTISVDLAAQIRQDLKPVIDGLGTAFQALGVIIETWFTLKIKEARQDLSLLWTFIQGSPQFRNMMRDFEILNEQAEKIRARNRGPVAPVSAPSGLPSNIPGAQPIPQSPLLTGVGGGAGGGGADRFVSELAEKIKALQKTWANAGLESRAFTQAFKSLTTAQKENYDVLTMLAPEINKMIAAQKPVTGEMLRLRDAELALRLERLESQKAWLAGNNLTQGQIERMQELGMSMEDIAGQYGVATDALNSYITSIKKQEQQQLATASFEAQLLDQQIRDRKRREDIELASNKAIADAERELNDYIRQQSTTTTDYQIYQIDRAAAEQIAQFSATGASAAAIKSYTDLVIQLSNRRKDALMVDEDALRNNSRATLQDIADRARNTYEVMKAHPADFSKTTIEHFKKIAEEAQRQADGTKSAWEKAFTALNYMGQIADAIPGKFGEIASAAVQAAENIAQGFAEGGLLGGIIASVAEGIKALSRIGGPSAEELEGRQIVESFENQLQDRLTAQQKLEAGNESWKLTTIAVRDAYLAAGFTAEQAEMAVDKLWKSSKQGADASRIAVLEIQAVLDIAAQKQEDLADAQVLQAEQVEEATAGVRNRISELDQEYNSLLKSIENEAPEDVMGVVEAATRARMEAIQDERATAQSELERITSAMEASFDRVAASAEDAARAIESAFSGITYHPNMEQPENLPDPVYYAHGGTAQSSWVARGTDTIPAMLTPGETVTPRGGGGAGTVIFELNGRVLAEAVVPEIPGTVKRLGVRA